MIFVKHTQNVSHFWYFSCTKEIIFFSQKIQLLFIALYRMFKSYYIRKLVAPVDTWSALLARVLFCSAQYTQCAFQIPEVLVLGILPALKSVLPLPSC